MRIVLASASPRRRELLSRIVNDFEVIPAKGEECINLSLFPEQIVASLAEAKCDEVFKANSDALVIGCDTIVVYDNRILGKPKDRQDAVNTLKMLSGKTHYVMTGVCVRYLDRKLVDFERTEVRFNRLTDEFIESYVDSGSPMDKAGSYGIQAGGVVREYYGSYTNVVCMPVGLVRKMMEEVLSDGKIDS